MESDVYNWYKELSKTGVGVCLICETSNCKLSMPYNSVRCSHCGINIAVETLARCSSDPLYAESFFGHLKNMYERTLYHVKNASTAILLAELANRGYMVAPDVDHDAVYKTLQENLIHGLYESETAKKQEPEKPPWSYEEAARSEFDLSDGSGLV